MLVLASSTLATGFSMYIRPFYIFQDRNMWKCFLDFLLSLLLRQYIPTYVVNSSLTDLLLVFIMGFEIFRFAYSNNQNGIEDILLIIIVMGHMYAFCLEYFTFYYFSILLSLTVAWMLLKSLRFRTIKPLLECKFFPYWY